MERALGNSYLLSSKSNSKSPGVNNSLSKTAGSGQIHKERMKQDSRPALLNRCLLSIHPVTAERGMHPSCMSPGQSMHRPESKNPQERLESIQSLLINYNEMKFENFEKRKIVNLSIVILKKNTKDALRWIKAKLPVLYTPQESLQLWSPGASACAHTQGCEGFSPEVRVPSSTGGGSGQRLWEKGNIQGCFCWGGHMGCV